MGFLRQHWALVIYGAILLAGVIIPAGLIFFMIAIRFLAVDCGLDTNRE